MKIQITSRKDVALLPLCTKIHSSKNKNQRDSRVNRHLTKKFKLFEFSEKDIFSRQIPHLFTSS